MGRVYPETRKVYHRHGFLVQHKIGKKFVDYQGVAGSEQAILEMNGDPTKWKRVGAGFEINPPEPKFPGYTQE